MTFFAHIFSISISVFQETSELDPEYTVQHHIYIKVFAIENPLKSTPNDLLLSKVMQHCWYTAVETLDLGWCCLPQHCGLLLEHADMQTHSFAKNQVYPDRKDEMKDMTLPYI